MGMPPKLGHPHIQDTRYEAEITPMLSQYPKAVAVAGNKASHRSGNDEVSQHAFEFSLPACCR